MAKRDVNLRFLQAEQEYLELTEILSDLKKDLDDGKIDLE